jgi:hypothetical protein
VKPTSTSCPQGGPTILGRASYSSFMGCDFMLDNPITERGSNDEILNQIPRDDQSLGYERIHYRRNAS